MDLRNIILACEEHVEIAIDECISKKESFPNMIIDENYKCSYCEKVSKYRIE
ncbi:CxxH/CxxC protein, BA_5709 family [Clostridium cavendishii DSM 21758]|uniref:CxxH/CxxC protein, BA_5709 family n=1 Tax=Clostridium cavendishii DSM 21758 TaxID=1121302 RepID=A0A1M6PS56_9CLOT|nr:CxxH/CxxC protein [Clostridium cavendishii]SHK10829.1 CxxH/CxxC protein, BA_5709 family [Clostridium cavendishii DSM 21758]